MSAPLPLRDVHLPPSPPWWPPAPGWWLLAVAVLALLSVPLLLRWRRARRHAAWRAQYRTALDAAGDGPARLAVLLELLRRAARQSRPGSELLQGEAWLQLLDPHHRLDAHDHALLQQGAWRRTLDPQALVRLQAWGEQRFIELRQGARR